MRTALVMMGVVLAIVTGCVRGVAVGRTRSPVSRQPYLSSSPSTFARSVPIAHPQGKVSATSDEQQIRAALDTQVAAWNQGDVDAFMKYYWHSDKTLFVGANGITRGWEAVLDRYHRAYPNREAMGQLTFSDIEIDQNCPREAAVIGEYHLRRDKDSPSGVFTLNFRKFAEGWRIVVDHTTAFAQTGVSHK